MSAGLGAGQLVHLERGIEALDGNRAERPDLYIALGEGERPRREQRGAGPRHLLHARGEVGRQADRSVVHAQVGADGTHYHLPGVHAHADLDGKPLRPQQLVRVTLHGLLHPERGIAGANGVVFVGEWGTEQGHDAVAHDLIDRTLVPMHRLHHAFNDWVQELAGLLRVPVGQRLHGALEVGEEHGDLLALAFQCGLA